MPHRAVIIRRARPTDLEALVDLAVAFREHLGRSDPSRAAFHESFAQLLCDAQAEFFLASDVDGASLGYVLCRYRYSAWTSGLDAEIEDLFVVSGSRRSSVGRRLLTFVIACARERRCRVIGLNTNERNAAAIALYKALGFDCERRFWSGARQLWFEKVLDSE